MPSPFGATCDAEFKRLFPSSGWEEVKIEAPPCYAATPWCEDWDFIVTIGQTVEVTHVKQPKKSLTYGSL